MSYNLTGRAKAASFLIPCALLLLAGCNTQSPSTSQRVAVLRFENLSADTSLDWIGRAATEIIAAELAAGTTAVLPAAALHASPFAQGRPISAPGESEERTAAIAEGATRLVIGNYSRVGGRLVLEITERDPISQKNLQSFTLTSTDASAIYPLADAAARRLTPAIQPFGSKNNDAIKSYAVALEAPDYQQATGAYARAVQADPDFAAAWFAWLGTASGHGDRPEIQNVLAGARQHSAGFSNLDRARLQLASAQVTGDRAAILAAVNELGRLRPDDPDSLRTVADQNFAQRQFPPAVAAYRRLSVLQPANASVWNQLGYSLLYSGDESGAMAALQKYQQLVPNDPNPLDSQGDVAFAFGHFAAAEKLYQQAAQKDPNFNASGDLLKAAQAHLLTGDLSGAEQKFEVYAAARRTAADPTLPFRVAEWRYLSGKHDLASAALSAVAADPKSTPQLKSAALSQLAVWDLAAGRRDRALQESNTALQTGAASSTTLIARFASENATTPADWASRADKILASPQVAPFKPLALGYAFYFAHQWQAAEPLWRQLVERSTPDDSVSPVIYAQILMELHRPLEAEPFVRLFPLLHTRNIESFLSLSIPRIFDIRAGVFDAQGKSADAAASRAMFKTLSPQ